MIILIVMVRVRHYITTLVVFGRTVAKIRVFVDSFLLREKGSFS